MRQSAVAPGRCRRARHFAPMLSVPVVDWSCCCLLRCECIAQKQMAPGAFDAHESSPERVLRRETLTSDESWSLRGGVATGDLRSERQEQFIQELPGKEVPEQLWPTLDQDDLARAHFTHRLDNCLGTERASTLHACDLHRCWDMLCADALFALRGRHEQDRKSTRLNSS